MLLGGYEINVSTSGMPQKVATGFAKVFESMVGASYEPIAYLGSQLVNGTNHALLCKQTLIVKEDVKAIVLVVLNEKPGDVDGSNFSIVEIKTLVSDGGAHKLGGLDIAPVTEIPAEALEIFNKHFGGFLGAKNKPFALLATQMGVRGGGYLFAVESDMVVSPTSMVAGTKSVNLVKIYGAFDEIETTPVLVGSNPNAEMLVGYSFTWGVKK